MKKYKHFTPQDRDIIAIELSKGTSKQKIAHILNVHISSIYLPSVAQNLYLSRRQNNINSSKFTKDVKFIIENGLKEDLSFSTICGIQHKKDKSFPSSRTLYNYFKRSMIKIPKSYRLNLKKKAVATKSQSKLKDANTKHISQMPPHIVTPKHFGHWELDLIESAGEDGYIISFVECLSEFALTQYINTKEAVYCQVIMLQNLHRVSILNW